MPVSTLPAQQFCACVFRDLNFSTYKFRISHLNFKGLSKFTSRICRQKKIGYPKKKLAMRDYKNEGKKGEVPKKKKRHGQEAMGVGIEMARAKEPQTFFQMKISPQRPTRNRQLDAIAPPN
jgi:hypothetical protein